jgi:tRNA 2-selenouridine synthase
LGLHASTVKHLPAKFNPRYKRSVLIQATEYLNASRENLSLLDLRAPVEFSQGHTPGAWNSPILSDEERHQVGLCYKEKGQAAAIQLGLQLVGPTREARVAEWLLILKKMKLPVLSCWRGGMRSETAQSWIRESGFEALRLRGGYKALRQELLKQLEQDRSAYVITGLTGSGKSALLRSLQSKQFIDLEKLANHRGSAFGSLNLPPQPAQQSFENALCYAIWQAADPAPLFFEDESRLIGRCAIPTPFFLRLKSMPRVLLETPLEQRISFIYSEYVSEPMAAMGKESLQEALAASLLSIRARLGGLAHQELLAKLQSAFRTGEESLHREWIHDLLVLYYDPLYAHSQQNEFVFRGDARACAQWLRTRTI